VTLSDSKIFNYIAEHRVATAELHVRLTIINCHCHFTLASGSSNFSTKIINKMVRRYYWLDLLSPILKQFSVLADIHLGTEFHVLTTLLNN